MRSEKNGVIVATDRNNNKLAEQLRAINRDVRKHGIRLSALWKVADGNSGRFEFLFDRYNGSRKAMKALREALREHLGICRN